MRSQTSIIELTNKDSSLISDTLINTVRSATAVDLRLHFAVRSVYTNSSLIYVQKKFNIRAASAFRYHAKTPNGNIKSPYPHIEDDRPLRSVFTLLRMGILYFGIELLYSLETALTVPILLQLKVPDNIYSFVWIMSPILGVLIQPILGIMSDRCQSRFGRRRPFIAVLAIGAYFGIGLILNSMRIGLWIGDTPESKIPYYAVIVTGIGVTFLDFCADSSDSPLRAFLLDVCHVDDQDTGLNMHAMLGGLGSALGFILAAVNWKNTFFKYIGDEFLILFVFATFVFIVTLIMTLTSAKEERFILKENSEIKSLISKLQTKNQKLLTTLPELEEETTSFINNENTKLSTDEDDIDRPITLPLLFKSMLNIPKELLFLMICQLFGWLSVCSITFFLTDFMAQAIYHGDPSANPDSKEFQNYIEGVKIGCYCLLSNALSSSLYAFILEKILLERFSTRFLYFTGCFLNAVLITCIFFTKNIYIIIILCSGIGILITTVSTLPFQMLSEFHQDGDYRRKSAEGTKRGIGIDCSLLSVSYFLASILSSVYSSPLINRFGDYTIIVTSAIISFINCIWISLFMIFPSSKSSETR